MSPRRHSFAVKSLISLVNSPSTVFGRSIVDNGGIIVICDIADDDTVRYSYYDKDETMTKLSPDYVITGENRRSTHQCTVV